MPDGAHPLGGGCGGGGICFRSFESDQTIQSHCDIVMLLEFLFYKEAGVLHCPLAWGTKLRHPGTDLKKKKI